MSNSCFRHGHGPALHMASSNSRGGLEKREHAPFSFEWVFQHKWSPKFPRLQRAQQLRTRSHTFGLWFTSLAKVRHFWMVDYTQAEHLPTTSNLCNISEVHKVLKMACVHPGTTCCYFNNNGERKEGEGERDREREREGERER